ncbi:MAG: hypothetical protein ABEJ55_07705 [Halanaeroarchaeum sp.]
MDGVPGGPDGTEIDLASVLVDLALLLAVPVGLLSVQVLLSAGAHQSITFYPRSPTPLARIGHAYVHFSTAALFQNLLGYGILAALAYLFAAAVGARRWFRFSLLTVLVVVPLASAVGDQYLLVGTVRGRVAVRGFSAIVAALGGLVLVSYLALVRRALDPRAAGVVGVAFPAGIVATIEATYRSVDSTATALLALAAVAVLVLEAGSRLAQGGWRRTPRGPVAIAAVLGVLVAGVMMALLGGLFPPDPFGGETYTNVYSHALGFAAGVVIGVWGHRYWSPVDWGPGPGRSDGSNS